MAESTLQPASVDPSARVLVAGASGFAGALAAEIVWRHPSLELGQVTSRSDVGARLDQLYPRYRVPLTLGELELDAAAADCDVAIVAYPHGAAAPVVAGLLERGLRVVDLSADFRIRDLDTYESWYGTHPAAELIEQAVYGLPELYRDRLADATLVANPGCYPTAAILTLAPLAEEGLIDDLVIDAKSGVSGAGRGKGDSFGFVAQTENASPYGTKGHRHEPEIAQELGELAGIPQELTFVPHLLPLDQGELVSCYVRTTRPIPQEELDQLYRDRYAAEPFIELAQMPPGVRDVRETNACRIHLQAARGDRLLAFGAIDNLWKGAAGQAVQNLNLMLGLPEGEGLG